MQRNLEIKKMLKTQKHKKWSLNFAIALVQTLLTNLVKSAG